MNVSDSERIVVELTREEAERFLSGAPIPVASQGDVRTEQDHRDRPIYEKHARRFEGELALYRSARAKLRAALQPQESREEAGR